MQNHMNFRKTWHSIGIGLLLFALTVGLFLYTSNTTAPENEIQQDATQVGTVSLTIEGLYTNKPTALSENETVLEVLQTLDSEDQQFQLSTKEYSGLGTLVESIHGKTNGTDTKYWQYKVNGAMPQIGADAFTLHNGDSVEWYFGKSAF